MTYRDNLRNIKNMCRICLTRGENMISLSGKLNSNLDDSPRIRDALENILSIKVTSEEKYPGKVCVMCLGHIKIASDLKLIYKKSQDIIQKYIHLSDMSEIDEVSSEISHCDLADVVKSDIEECSYSSDTSEDLDLVKSHLQHIFNLEEDKNAKQAVDLMFDNSHSTEEGLKTDTGKEDKYITENDGNNSNKTDRCPACHKRFVSKEKLAEHLVLCRKPMARPIKCKFCSAEFPSKLGRDHHVQMNHTIKSAQCEICKEVFKNSKALAYHRTTKHNSEGKKFVCNLCGKGFYLKNGLSQHMDIHTRDVSKVICPVCGKGFHYRGGLFYHMKMHRNERNYSCEFCGRKFLNVSGLKKHIRIHTGEKPYRCQYCNRTFLSKNILDNHEKTHTGVKTKFCPYCQKGFITAYSLKVHISSHVGCEPCTLCKRSFLNDEVLELHWKFKHDIK